MDKRTWAEVDLDAIAHNIKEIRKITNPNAKIMAVVKADAQFGHYFCPPLTGVHELNVVFLKNTGAGAYARRFLHLEA